MEIRKDSLSSVKLCRFCLSQDSQDLRSLYDRSGGRARNNTSLSMKILSAISIEVFPSDKMPSYICSRCSYFMDICYEYKQICRNADESIFQYVQTGSTLKSIAWPGVLTKGYESAKASSASPAGVMKTVVDGGATVEVTSQDASDEGDEDDDDENVYKVKIGDGKEETRIKVITSDDTKKPKKESWTESRGAAGCWACDECPCTYPLQQLLELHKMRKHRERSFACHHCHDKFYSKNDLATHAQRHSDLTPFQCVACDRKFKRIALLRRHERIAHSGLPRFECPVESCSVTFLAADELQAHVDRHDIQRKPAFVCDQCGKKFHERSTLKRHKSTQHAPDGAEWSCEYCSERFASVAKLARHVRTHAGERPYPCKYCDKTFTKSHHYTRHVRMKHADVVGSESFRCEQCGASFSGQDDLMYHSAIHATQDLTCPLCHEKFHNVDGVTAHIKSHVNGMEFMCDYCELVFTSKQKLDSHLVAAHEDELNNDNDRTLGQDESSMEEEGNQEEDDDTFNVKDEGDHMVVEIKKPGSFILSDSKGEIDYRPETDNTCSEESETDTPYGDLSADTTVTMATPPPVKAVPVTAKPATVVSDKNHGNKTAAILRKAEEIKKKFQQKQVSAVATKKEDKPVAKVEPNNSGGNDKSLKLLEKELQELQRTNSRQEAAKTPAKLVEPVRNNRRPQLATSTPKLRSVNEKKVAPITPKTPVEKKIPERRAIKENKEPVKTPTPKEDKDAKEVKTPNAKEEKERANNTSVKEDKDRDTKEKEMPKSVARNGASDTNMEDVRRSSRPSKVKDYVKMAQHRPNDDSENDDSDDADDEEYAAEEARSKGRRGSGKKTVVKPSPLRKRGRPRKTPVLEVPTKVRKQNHEEEGANKSEPEEAQDDNQNAAKAQPADANDANNHVTSERATTEQESDVMKSPMGQTLKKVPIKSLPPGVKPLPLPTNVRSMNTGNISEMQIGKKMVKVQKIVMTKAEVEAMAKKGLLEMKDGTMVLKQGIKLPTSDATSIKSTLVGEESPSKKSAPTRCDMDDNV